MKATSSIISSRSDAGTASGSRKAGRLPVAKPSWPSSTGTVWKMPVSTMSRKCFEPVRRMNSR